MAAEHGERARYKEGCRCDPCRMAENNYRRVLRQRKKSGELPARSLSAVPPVPAIPVAGDEPAAGSVEADVRKEIEKLAATEDRSGVAAVALAMARILDSPVALAQHPAAASRLMESLDKLRKGGRRARGKLAAVKDMTAG